MQPSSENANKFGITKGEEKISTVAPQRNDDKSPYALSSAHAQLVQMPEGEGENAGRAEHYRQEKQGYRLCTEREDEKENRSRQEQEQVPSDISQ